MAKDTLTLKFCLEADFQTIQAIRQRLHSAQAQAQLTQQLTHQAQRFVSAQPVGPFALTARKVAQC